MDEFRVCKTLSGLLKWFLTKTVEFKKKYSLMDNFFFIDLINEKKSLDSRKSKILAQYKRSFIPNKFRFCKWMNSITNFKMLSQILISPRREISSEKKNLIDCYAVSTAVHSERRPMSVILLRLANYDYHSNCMYSICKKKYRKCFLNLCSIPSIRWIRTVPKENSQ